MESFQNHYQKNFNDDGDFGDFQTFENLKPLNNNQNENTDDDYYLKTGNIFELSWFEFQTFRQKFNEKLIEIFDDDPKNLSLATDFCCNTTTIPSQEDTINECPIWLHLINNFRNQTSLNFNKSLTFKYYLASLKLSNNNSNNNLNNNNDDDNNNNNNNLPANTRKRIIADDEEDIANDLDMHSLIISSFSNNINNNNNNNEQQQQQNDRLNQNSEYNADQVIKEIESLYSSSNNQSLLNNNNKNNNCIIKNNNANQKQLNKNIDPLLSLDAATLLNVALKSWQSNNNNYNNYNRISLIDDYDINLETFEYCHNGDDNNDNVDNDDDDNDHQESSYHSLPTDLNSDQIKVSNSILLKKNDNIDKSDQQKISSTKTKTATTTTTTNQNDKQIEFIEKLKQLTIVQLNELYMELEQIIQIRSEVLIQELALRDELEYEKEQKNQFISLLLSVQNKRRHYLNSRIKSSSTTTNKKFTNRNVIRRNSNDSIRSSSNNNNKTNKIRNNVTSNSTSSKWLPSAVVDLSSSLSTTLKQSILLSSTQTSTTTTKSKPVYLTTVIPYTNSMIPIDSSTLDILIKLLRALNDDSPTVPALLTDYILKVICP